MRRVIRETDQLFRIGGDEFVLLCLDLDSPDDVDRVAAAITHTFQQTVGIEGQEVYLGASLGIAIFPDHGRDVDTLLRRAEVAMYFSKRSGRGQFRVFTSDKEGSDLDPVSISGRLPRAMQAGHLSVRFQPQFRAQSLDFVAAEALLRWHDPELGQVSPARFIPLAEQSGIIVQIGTWVLDRIMAMSTGNEVGFMPSTIAVNLSPAQLSYEGFVNDVDTLLATYNMNPQRLLFEVTEYAVLNDWDTSTRTLAALRERGIRIAIDDFGTGYSSLYKLRYLSADQLKVDRRFVARIDEDPQDREIVRWIIELGHAFGLEVCLEGIETEDQLHIAVELGADLLQGFFLGTVEEASALLKYAPLHRVGTG
jgi:predicted signal transduction protein with EAL and GGDEF domain